MVTLSSKDCRMKLSHRTNISIQDCLTLVKYCGLYTQKTPQHKGFLALLGGLYLIARATACMTPLSNGPGMVLSVFGALTSAARALAAFSFISSVIFVTLLSSAPRNTPGNASELFI